MCSGLISHSPSKDSFTNFSLLGALTGLGPTNQRAASARSRLVRAANGCVGCRDGCVGCRGRGGSYNATAAAWTYAMALCDDTVGSSAPHPQRKPAHRLVRSWHQGNKKNSYCTSHGHDVSPSKYHLSRHRFSPFSYIFSFIIIPEIMVNKMRLCAYSFLS